MDKLDTQMRQPNDPDYVDQLLQQWDRERPDLDIMPMGVIARISRAAHLLEKAQETVFSAYGLHRGRFDVLAALRRSGPPYCLSPTSLYNSLLISSGAMTHRLDRLTSAGLIERVADERDGRGLLVRLTAAGNAMIDEAIAAHLDNEASLISGLSAREKESLTDVLRKLLLLHGDRPHASDSADGAIAARPKQSS